jgi:hypothetical protein
MKFILSSIALLFFLVTLCAGQSGRKVVVVASPDAPGVITGDKLTECFLRLAREWKIPQKDLPNIVVFHVSKKAAETAFVDRDTAIRRNTAGSDGSEYFEVWLVGKPELKYVLALQNVLEYQFGLRPTEKQRNEVVDWVGRIEDATISVQEGK